MQNDCMSDIIHEKSFNLGIKNGIAKVKILWWNLHYQFRQKKYKNDSSQPILVASSIKLTDYSVKEMKVDKMSKSE